jgi:hypothetical protein
VTTLEVHPRADWTPALLDELHTLAITMSAESREHFERHAISNDCVYLFRDQSALVGFQFWRTVALPQARLILGGKLRIAPSHRRRGLHLRAGLAYYRAQGDAYRVSLAGLFGFVSITRALSHYEVISTATSPAWLTDAVGHIARESDFAFDPASGLVRVGIQVTPAQLAAYPESFYASPQARAYAAVNPDYRTNGTYIAFGFPLSPANLAAMERAVRAYLT